MTVDAYPLQWPANFPRTKPEDRQPARFHGGGKPLTIAAGRDRILSEISVFTRVGQSFRIDPDQVVISSDVPLRRDGKPASGRRMPDDPGVCVYLYLDGKPQNFPCDRWDRVADNMAAIAAHLDAMRGMERWGVGGGTAHYDGFAQIEHQPERRWYDVLGCSAQATHAEIVAAYRKARAKAHPDRGGSDAEFQEVNDAYVQAGAERS
jgi:hypothetical protein